jgi:urea transport system permease protein
MTSGRWYAARLSTRVLMRKFLPVLSCFALAFCAGISFAQDTNSATATPLAPAPAAPSAPAPIANPTPRQQLAEAILASSDDQTGMIGKMTDTSDPLTVKTILTAWIKGGVYLHTNPDNTIVPFTIEATGPVRIDNGQPLAATETTPVDTDSRLRKTIRSTLDLLALADPDPNLRRSAVMKLGMMQRTANLPALQARLAKETDSSVRQALEEAISIIALNDSDPTAQIAAIKKLTALDSISSLDLLKGLEDNSPSPQVQQAAGLAIQSLNNYLFWVNFYGTIFRGLSLGSVLLVAALGLAITFGLMGVINMAHGELIAVGAYASYVTEGVFIRWFGSGGEYWYFFFAIPFAFITAALVGLILERSIIRFLYNRPLESLLATWGVSLVLQQLFRMFFGSANVDVDSPSWLLGNVTISNVIFGYNRLFVIGFAAVIILLTWLLLTKSPLGLLIRSVTQNRQMAACVGVRTERVNMMTFAFGSGLAGLAGAFLSQIGNVGPSMGQNYIIDCFMTVVVGGVGNIVGTICSAMGIGMADQMLQEILQNPVIGQIIVLVCIILFLQWKPGGLFPSRGRGLED